ncbi:hypothetical protein APHAL10511_003411 [Amanita phalloides]|nr:hypothetical protein APHAL10511_003411 [Amanita phalloides]
MADVEMKKTDEKAKAEETKKEEEKPVPLTSLQELKTNVAFIDRAVAKLEPRFAHRVLHTLTSVRKELEDNILRTAIEEIQQGCTRVL